jgi:hypothetical protein
MVPDRPTKPPRRASNWLAAKDLSVSSFVNSVAVRGPAALAVLQACQVFGGCPVPIPHIALDGARAG